MAHELTDVARLSIDLELPPEAQGLALNELDENQLFRILRLVFWTGYERGQADPEGTLRKGVQAECVSTA